MVILADGVAGLPEGERASALAVQAVEAVLADDRAQPAGVLRRGDLYEIAELVWDAFEHAHHAVASASLEDDRFVGMGTTLMVVAVIDDQALIAHLGDSRCYRMRGGALEQLTRDHRRSPAELLSLTSDEIEAVRPLVCLLSGAIGIDSAPMVEFVIEALEPEDRLLACTNGLYEALALEEIVAPLREHEGPAEACEALTRAALAARAEDDVTVAVIDYPAA